MCNACLCSKLLEVTPALCACAVYTCHTDTATDRRQPPPPKLSTRLSCRVDWSCVVGGNDLKTTGVDWAEAAVVVVQSTTLEKPPSRGSVRAMGARREAKHVTRHTSHVTRHTRRLKARRRGTTGEGGGGGRDGVFCCSCSIASHQLKDAWRCICVRQLCIVQVAPARSAGCCNLTAAHITSQRTHAIHVLPKIQDCSSTLDAEAEVQAQAAGARRLTQALQERL